MDAASTNDVWAMDFAYDQLASGKKQRILTVVNTFIRVSPVIDMQFNYRGEDAVTTLDKAYKKSDYPKTIRIRVRLT